MKNTSAVVNLTDAKLEAMFNLCKAFNIEVVSDYVKIDNCNMDEGMMTHVTAKYYEEAIRESFHKYVKMYATVMSGEFKVLKEEKIEIVEVQQKSIYGAIVDEDGNKVSEEYLLEILEISKDKDDFLIKVNNGITQSWDYVTLPNNDRIQSFYNTYK